MPQEKHAALPLSGAEVKEAILYKVAESLERTCHLKDDCAYHSFRADISVRLILNDFGRDQPDNHIVVAQEGEVDLTAESVGDHVVMEPMPPNQVRIDTSQDIPVKVVEDGKTVIKRVKYAAKKRAKVRDGAN